MAFQFKSAPTNSNYISAENFSTYNVPKTNEKLWSTAQGYSIAFEIGPTVLNYGPNSLIGQCYIADYLSEAVEWDSFCESCTTNTDFVKANAGDILPFTKYTPIGITIGECNIYNAACRSFLDLSDFNIIKQKFNPDDSKSKIVNIYKLLPYHSARMYIPPDPNNNILLNKILDKPQKYLNLLLLLKDNADFNKIKGTRIYDCLMKIVQFEKINRNN